MLLYFYTPPKPLISKLFNHDISPSLSLSRDSRALRCRRRRRRRLLFFSFPRCPPNPPLTDTNTTTSRKISRGVLRVHVDSRRAVSSVAQSCRTYFSTPRKSHPPLADIRRRALIFLTRSFSHSLFLSCEHYYILTRLSLLLSFSPSVHTPTLSLSLLPLFRFFRFLSLSFSLPLNLLVCYRLYA